MKKEPRVGCVVGFVFMEERRKREEREKEKERERESCRGW